MEMINEIIEWLKNGGEGLAIACIGNELRCDDIVGLLFCRQLADKCGLKIKSLECPGGLELCTHRLSEIKPQRLLVVDGVKAGLEPGSIVFTCSLDDIVSFEPITTHNLPLDAVIRYVRETIPSIREVCLLGIQVSCLDIAGEPNKHVVEAAEKLVDLICNTL